MASMTAHDVIAAAGRRAGITAGEEVMTAAEQADGLTDLNLMMYGFQSRGISYAHTDLAATDIVNMPDGMLDNLIWMMVEKLASGDYGLPISPDNRLLIEAARTALQAYYYVPRRAVIDHALRNRLYGGYNFTRGT